MAIIYYPNRSQRGSVSPVEQQMKRGVRYTNSGGGDITSVSIDDTISPEYDWSIQSILFNFSGATARDYSAKVQNGRRIVTDLNDYLWFHMEGTNPQRIILSSGFYTGTELAVELQTQLDANTAYVDAGTTFTVAYDNATGIFLVTPSAGTIKYLNVNAQQTIQIKDSIAGHLFGFATTGATFTANVASDVTVKALDDNTGLIDESASSVLTDFYNTETKLSIDQSLAINTSAAAIDATYTVTYSLDY